MGFGDDLKITHKRYNSLKNFHKLPEKDALVFLSWRNMFIWLKHEIVYQDRRIYINVIFIWVNESLVVLEDIVLLKL